MINLEDIKKLIEKQGFSVSDTTFGMENEPGWDIQQFTPLGEDWYISLEHNNSVDTFIDNLKSYTNNFDIDEEVEPYISIRGTRGVPSSISDLLEDAKWKQKTLKKLLTKILNAQANDRY